MNITNDNSPITDSLQHKTKTQKTEKSINKSLSLDKEKLFESFLLFTNFISMNRSMNKKASNNNKTCVIENSIKEENEIKNYDEIPIKPLNVDFIELVEKSIANDNSINKDEVTTNKKKIINKRPLHKKIINVSKPSKKDKKYSYYTDIIDENGKINENKIIKRNKFLSPQSTKSEIKKLLFDSTSIDSSIKKAKTITSHSNDDNTIKEKVETENKEEEKKEIIDNRSPKEKKIEQRLKELNIEINKVKVERQKIYKLKLEYEKLLIKLKEDIDILSIRKADYEIYKETEMKRIDNNRKDMIQDIKRYNNMIKENKSLEVNFNKDKAIIEELSKQIEKMNKENKEKEDSNNCIINELKETLQVLTNSKKDISISPKVNKKQITKYKTSRDLIPKKNITSKDNGIKPQKQITKSKTSVNKKVFNKPKIDPKPITVPKSLTALVSPKGYKSTFKPTSPSQNKKSPPSFSETFDFIIPSKYLNSSNYTLINSTKNTDCKTINKYTNNKTEIIFPSGVIKELYEDGNYQLIHFTNGDKKQIFPDGRSVYFYKAGTTTETTYPNGLIVYKFKSGQIEKHYPKNKTNHIPRWYYSLSSQRRLRRDPLPKWYHQKNQT